MSANATCQHLRPIVVAYQISHGVRCALERAGNRLVSWPGDHRLCYVEIIHPPAGLELVPIGPGNLALRLATEPSPPGEWPAESVPWWERGQWVPCPECGYALLWCEAGFVPGWRICLAGHACLLADDGRSATRQPEHDAATLAATRPLPTPEDG